MKSTIVKISIGMLLFSSILNSNIYAIGEESENNQNI
jgi:hypothetical protein